MPYLYLQAILELVNNVFFKTLSAQV